MGGPCWEITLGERAFLIRAPGFTEYISDRLIASDDALFFRLLRWATSPRWMRMALSFQYRKPLTM